MWRHLKLLKRGGRAHALGGVEGTASGELAVLCPACPNPDFNLPKDWRKVPKESAYVKGIFILRVPLTLSFQVLVLSIVRH